MKATHASLPGWQIFGDWLMNAVDRCAQALCGAGRIDTGDVVGLEEIALDSVDVHHIRPEPITVRARGEPAAASGVGRVEIAPEPEHMDVQGLGRPTPSRPDGVDQRVTAEPGGGGQQGQWEPPTDDTPDDDRPAVDRKGEAAEHAYLQTIERDCRCVHAHIVIPRRRS
ncbi:MAG TPA: hypothetical protein PKH97_12680 [Tetrasphaera sp.]|uniref:hypothetical protein n=1 Tax=Nostocoides sp. TaxID=1917966 RepID=UPI002C780A18|nr:hypothetical protein [Tetrasphaera sp.]HNQ08026.1 hypothetical protein [Tetrasphaera sp.]